jgi:putative transcription factor
MECELCGNQDALVNAVVEGSMVKVCRQCSRYGHVILLEKPLSAIKEEKKKEARLEIPEEIITEDYGSLIKSARERLKLTQKELALNLAEKESIIHKLESYYLEPSLELARKLEKFLSIKLIYLMNEDMPVKKVNFKDGSMTIGDILSIKK